MSGTKRPPRGGFSELDRRTFLATAGRFSFWGLVAAVARSAGTARAAEPASAEHVGVTPGFPVAAGSDQQRAIAALIEAVVPGADNDPTGESGALGAGALNLVYDDFYPMRSYIPAIVMLIDGQAQMAHGKAFAELGQQEREDILAEVQESLPFLRHGYRFIRGIYYADLHDAGGGKALGFPGPNLGYVDHPLFSFRRPMSQELTDEGYLP